MTQLISDVLSAVALLTAGVLAVLEAVPVLQDAFIGAGTGALVARLAIRRLERRHGELPARRVRQIETAWIVGLAALGAVISLVATIR